MSDKKIRQPEAGSKQARLRELRDQRQRVIDAEIPPFLQAAKRPPTTADQIRKLTAMAKAAAPKWDQPKGGIEPSGQQLLTEKKLAPRIRKLELQARKLDANGKTKQAAAKRAQKAKLAAKSPALQKAIVASTVEPSQPAATTPHADQPESKAMRTATKRKSTTTTKSKSSARRSMKKNANARTPNKSDIVEKMLLSKNGASAAELSKATGWPYVNVRLAAKRAGKKLVEKDGRFSLV